MKEISVHQISSQEGGFIFDVMVKEGSEATHHRVGLRQSYYDQLSGGKIAPEELVKRSFEFLLEREPKEAILRAFNLRDISNYFPEFEKEITKLSPRND